MVVYIHLVLGRQRQEDQEFKASLGSIASSRLWEATQWGSISKKNSYNKQTTKRRKKSIYMLTTWSPWWVPLSIFPVPYICPSIHLSIHALTHPSPTHPFLHPSPYPVHLHAMNVEAEPSNIYFLSFAPTLIYPVPHMHTPTSHTYM